MWPLPRLNNKSIQIILGPEHIACYWIQSDTNKQIQIQAAQRFELPIATDTVIYNPTAIQQTINSFIAEHKLTNAYSYFVIDTPLTHEQLIHHTNSFAQLDDLVARSVATHYGCCYIGPDADQSLFYVCSIAHALLLQLKALHTHLPLNMQAVRTPLTTQLDLYKHLQNAQFSQSQVVQAIDQERMLIKSLMQHEQVQRYFKKIPDTSTTDVIYALGSFLGSLL